MKTSQKGIDLIKEFEGFKAKSYKCPSGVLTIGYGHTGKDVKPGMTVTEKQAEELIRVDLSSAEKTVNAKVTGDISQYQFDALVSFTYNCGAGNLSKSTLLKKVNANPDDPTIEKEFAKYNIGGGKVLPGLVRRRKAEADLYFRK